MTTWTTPKTFTAVTLPVTDMNTYVRDNTNYLYESIPPGMAGSADIAGVGGAGTAEEWGSAITGLTWSPSNPTTVDSNTTIPNFLYISNQADATERLGTKSWSPTGAAAFDARLGGVVLGADTSVASVSGRVGLHIGDSGNSNRLLLSVAYAFDTNATTIAASTYAAGSYIQRGATVTIGTPKPVYLRITRDASNNNSFYWSTNGVLWNFIATQALTLTVDNIGLRVVGNLTAGFQGAIDWMRTSV
jgi:hypothetical protein